MQHADVRRAQSSDQTTVGDLWVKLLREQEKLDDRFEMADDARDRWDNDFSMWLDDETSRIYVAEADGEVVGFVSARRWGPPPIYAESSEVYLDELYVRPSDRRQGYGTQLLNAVRHWTEQIGAKRIRLGILTANEEARAFWQAQEAIPLTVTLTIEGTEQAGDERDEGTEKIGF